MISIFHSRLIGINLTSSRSKTITTVLCSGVVPGLLLNQSRYITHYGCSSLDLILTVLCWCDGEVYCLLLIALTVHSTYAAIIIDISSLDEYRGKCQLSRLYTTAASAAAGYDEG